MKNLLMTKSSDSKSDLVKRHALRPYKSRQKSSVAFDLKALRFEREQHVGNPKHTASVDDCSEYWLGNFANRSLYFYAGGGCQKVQILVFKALWFRNEATCETSKQTGGASMMAF